MPKKVMRVYRMSKKLNSVISELRLIDTESANRNKLKDLFTELKGIKFVMTLILEFKEVKSDDETKYSTFYSYSKAETVLN